MIKLRQYQEKGVEFLVLRKTALLADEGGLGKTFQAIEAGRRLKAERILILAPKTLIYQWKSEIELYFSGTGIKSKITIIDGSKKEREKLYASYSGGYLIMGYETARTDIAILIVINWDLIISDEAARLGNPRTKLYKAMKILKSLAKFTLSGVPINNSPMDIFGIINWLSPNYLGSYWNFQARYCIKNYWGSVIGYQGLDELALRIKPFYLRRKVSDVLTELPPLIESDIIIELSAVERELYNRIKKEIYEELTGGRADHISLASLGNAIVQITRLQQITGHSSLIGSEYTVSSKLEVLKDKVNAIVAGDDKVIIFSKFAKIADIIQKEIGGLKITGAIKNIDRDNILESFKEKGNNILTMTNCGAEGLNIQSANNIIFYDFDWSLGKKKQKVWRAHRMGQKKTVFVYNLIARNTIDEKVMKTLKAKGELSEKLITVDLIEDILK